MYWEKDLSLDRAEGSMEYGLRIMSPCWPVREIVWAIYQDWPVSKILAQQNLFDFIYAV